MSADYAPTVKEGRMMLSVVALSPGGRLGEDGHRQNSDSHHANQSDYMISLPRSPKHFGLTLASATVVSSFWRHRKLVVLDCK